MDEARARQVLGVAADAPPDAVRAAYRRLLRRHHPDVAGSSAGSTRRTAELNQAYAVATGTGTGTGPESPAGPAPSPTPPSAPANRSDAAPTFDPADDADSVITVDASPVGDDLLDVFNRLCIAADAIGSLSYVDRANTILETVLSPPGGPTCSLMLTLDQHEGQTLAYCTLESFDARPGPPIEEVVALLTRALDHPDPT